MLPSIDPEGSMVYPFVVTARTPSSPSDAEVITALRAAAARGLVVHPRVQPDIRQLDYDVADICELIAQCGTHEIVKHEPDYDPDRNDYIVVLKIEIDESPYALYVKVALHLPHMARGKLLAFKEWRD